MLESSDPSVRKKAVRMLGKLEALDDLRGILEHRHENVRAEAMRVLFLLKDMEGLRRAMKSERVPHYTKLYVFKNFGEIEREKDVEKIAREALEDKNSKVKKEAVRALWTLRDKEGLRKAVEDEDVRVEAIKGLIAAKDKEGLSKALEKGLIPSYAERRVREVISPELKVAGYLFKIAELIECVGIKVTEREKKKILSVIDKKAVKVLLPKSFKKLLVGPCEGIWVYRVGGTEDDGYGFLTNEPVVTPGPVKGDVVIYKTIDPKFKPVIVDFL